GIRALPSAVAQAVVGVVDDWVFTEWADYWTARQRKAPRGAKVDAMALILGGDPVLTRKLKVWRRRLTVAQEADADPVRKRLRGGGAAARLRGGAARRRLRAEAEGRPGRGRRRLPAGPAGAPGGRPVRRRPRLALLPQEELQGGGGVARQGGPPAAGGVRPPP